MLGQGLAVSLRLPLVTWIATFLGFMLTLHNEARAQQILPVPSPLVVPVPTGTTEEIAIRCAQFSRGNHYVFAECVGRRIILSARDHRLLDCAVTSERALRFATCAAPEFGIKLSKDQRIVTGCAMEANGEQAPFARCLVINNFTRSLKAEDVEALQCAERAGGDTAAFVACAANYVVGRRASREQRIAIECAAESRGDASRFTICAGTNLFSFNLNPEQQIAVQCVVQTGGEPLQAAGCIASELTARELTKCLRDGFGGARGCFGDNNDLVGRNGWVARTMGQVAGGPNSLVRNPNQIWGGRNSFLRNPSQIWGGPNSFVRRPEQIFGGPNSVFNNPGQLAPPPLEVGRIGRRRFCLPWC